MGAAAALKASELEIAHLAAAGRSSKEIADHLVLSVGTGDNHLQNDYTKLGASGRAELTSRLRARAGSGDPPDIPPAKQGPR